MTIYRCNQNRTSKRLLFWLLMMIFISYMPSAILANTAPLTASEPLTVPANSTTLTMSRLAEINAALQELAPRLDSVRSQLQTTNPERNYEKHSQLTERLAQLESQKRNLKTLFENIATGGVDRSVFFEPDTKAEFDWQNELLSVAQPLLAEMTKLTERPRMIENLRQQREALDEKIAISRQALAQLRQNAADAKETKDISLDTTLADIKQLTENWEQILTDFERQDHLLQLQISSQVEQEETVYTQVKRITKEFLIGRGLVLLLAIVLFSLSILLIQGGLNQLLAYRQRQEIIRVSPKKRFVILILRTIGWLFSISLFLMILYIAGDVVLFSLILVVLALLLVASRNYLPRYVEEAKLFLNIGPVRENERVVLQGLPWKVKSIGFQVWLENPELSNGRLRLPMKAVKGLTSRPLYRKESWFPTRRGDYVILNDHTFGRIEEQTPEFVSLSVLHATKTYQTTTFLNSQPRNLSRENFILNPICGVALFHQQEPPALLASQLKESITQKLKASPLAEHILGVSVEFLEVTRSSLDFQVLVSVDGSAAADYFKLQRMIQIAFIAACHQHRWRLPIEQRGVQLTATSATVISE